MTTTLTNNSVPVNFVIPEFLSTIRLNQDILTEADEVTTIPGTSFQCNVEMDKNLFCDTFLFSTNDINRWDTAENKERTMFFVNRSLNSSSVSWWKQYANSGAMFNIANSSVSSTSNTRLSVSTYTSKTPVNVTEIFCAWYMYRILNGIKDAQVLVNNANQIKTSLNTLFKENVIGKSIDNVLWHYNCWSSTELYTDIYSLPLDSVPSSRNSKYSYLRNPGDNSNIQGIPFITNNTAAEQTLPQRLFEQLSYADMQRINTVCADNHITTLDVYDSVNNPNSRISPALITGANNVILTNMYKFPFLAGDSLVFQLNIKVKENNTLTIFNTSGGGNLTSTIDNLNTSFNNASVVDVDYLSFLVKINLVDYV